MCTISWHDPLVHFGCTHASCAPCRLNHASSICGLFILITQPTPLQPCELSPAAPQSLGAQAWAHVTPTCCPLPPAGRTVCLTPPRASGHYLACLNVPIRHCDIIAGASYRMSVRVEEGGHRAFQVGLIAATSDLHTDPRACVCVCGCVCACAHCSRRGARLEWVDPYVATTTPASAPAACNRDAAGSSTGDSMPAGNPMQPAHHDACLPACLCRKGPQE